MAPSQQHRRLFAPGFAAACAAMALGALMLLLDLGRASNAILLVTSPQLTYLTFGSWALALAIAATAGLAWVWGVPSTHVRYRPVRALTWFAFVAGIAVAVYTGLLLWSLGTVPFWTTPWLPVLFTLSALSCGCALVLSCAGPSGSIAAFSRVLGRVVRFDIVLLALESLAASAMVVTAFGHPYAVASQGANTLLYGSLSPLFLGGFAVVGIAVPVIVETAQALGKIKLSSAALVAATCVLVGGFILRYCVVAVGAHPEVWAVVS